MPNRYETDPETGEVRPISEADYQRKLRDVRAKVAAETGGKGAPQSPEDRIAELEAELARARGPKAKRAKRATA